MPQPLARRLHLKVDSDIISIQLNLKEIAMFTSRNFLDTSERAVCLIVSMLIVTSVLALGAFGIDSMVQNAQNTQVTALSVPA